MRGVLALALLFSVSKVYAASTSMGVERNLNDNGRQVYIASATAITPVTTEAVVAMSSSTALNNSGGGTTWTSLAVPASKTIRIQRIAANWRSTAALQGNTGIVRLRANANGACTATSAIVDSITLSTPSASGFAAGAVTGPGSPTNYIDGLEFSGTNQFCFTQIFANTQGALDIQLVGLTHN